MARTHLARSSSKVDKHKRGRVPIERAPVAIRSKSRLGDAFQTRIRAQLASHSVAAGDALERATVRFADVNGPKGGVDTECKIKLVIAGAPTVVVAKRAPSPEEAFAFAVRALGPALDPVARKHGSRSSHRQSLRAVTGKTTDLPTPRARRATG
jgi:hypothetical protein